MELRHTEPVTLAKALSVKNRLAGRLAQARTNIETYNSVMAGQREDEGESTLDVRAEYERLRARGAPFLTEPVESAWEVRAFFRDPDGHLLEISEAKAPP